MSWWDHAKAILVAIFERLGSDVPRLLEAWRTLLGVVFLAFLAGIYYSRRIAGGRSQQWRASNPSLRRKAIEFTSRLRHYAAGREREMRLAWKRGNVDPGDIAINLKSDYNGSFRVDAVALREALEARLTGEERRARRDKNQMLDRLYEDPESHTDLVAEADDLDRMAHALPRRRPLIMWLRGVFLP
jgi:hypothetical protein